MRCWLLCEQGRAPPPHAARAAPHAQLAAQPTNPCPLWGKPHQRASQADVPVPVRITAYDDKSYEWVRGDLCTTYPPVFCMLRAGAPQPLSTCYCW